MTARKDFAEGRIVRLKTGGPFMVAEANLSTDDGIPVTWFAGNEVKRDMFHYLALQLIAEDSAELATAVRTMQDAQMFASYPPTALPAGTPAADIKAALMAGAKLNSR